MRPISDRWIVARLAEISQSEEYHDRMAVKALRELQRVREAVQKHRRDLMAKEEIDQILYRAVLPERQPKKGKK